MYLSRLETSLSFPDFFFAQNVGGYWYKVPEYLRQDWLDWQSQSEPGANAKDEDWEYYEDGPPGIEQCEHPSNYVVRESTV